MKRIVSIFLVFLMAMSAIAQTGGGYNLEQNVIGNGGWRSDGGGYTVLGTMGQSNAGSVASGGSFHLIDGLWAIENPTANSPFVGIGGRIVRQHGVGIPRVLVTITNQTTDQTYQVYSQAQGYYNFANVPTGANYVITVSHAHFQFEPNSISLFISQDRNNVDFVSSK
jgi:hypothetical protein